MNFIFFLITFFFFNYYYYYYSETKSKKKKKEEKKKKKFTDTKFENELNYLTKRNQEQEIQTRVSKEINEI
jgi:hypothetical protein